jgi:hypothetical protein
MAKPKTAPAVPTATVLNRSIQACIANGERLIADAYCVEFQEPPCTKLMLSMIAQEEFAKAFLLFLVREDVVPWSRELLRAMNDHACKQLVGVIVEYIIGPDWETLEELEALVAEEWKLGERVPPPVASAINILRHEKIGRWESNTWIWAEPPEYDPNILRIAEGKRDRLKQDALYVRLGMNADVVSTPLDLTEASVKVEFERVESFCRFIKSIVNDLSAGSDRYLKVREGLKMLFDKAR